MNEIRLATSLPHTAIRGEYGDGRLDSATAWLTGLSCTTVVFSIATSEILLGAALACLLLSRKRLNLLPRLNLPLLAFAAWTLLAVAFSDAPLTGFPQVKKLVLLFIPLLTVNAFQNRGQLWRVAQGVMLAATVAAFFGLIQFGRDYFTLERRGLGFYDNYVVHQITGFMSHWMTFGGQLMIVVLLILSVALFGGERIGRYARWISLSLLCLALLAAFTRGIWLGTLAGATFLVGSYRRWMVALVPAGVLLLYLLSPSWLQKRDQSIFEPEQDSSSLSRLVMIQTGLRMIETHPVFGLGPERVGPEFDRYKPERMALPPAWYGHLHDTFLQIAAERGVPCLLMLLWFFYEVAREGFRRGSRPIPRERALGLSAVAATIGLMVSGLFEYNFGDSEVLMLYLFVISLSSAWHLVPSPAPPSASQ